MKKTNSTYLYIRTAACALAAAALMTAGDAMAQQIAGGQITVKNSKVKKSGQTVNVSMNLDLSHLDITSNEGVVLVPMLVAEGDTAKMPAAEIYGRKRYIYYQRNGKTVTEKPGLIAKRNAGKEQTLSYSYALPYERWMNNATLVMGEGACGCDQTPLGDYAREQVHGVNLYSAWNLQYAYIQPQPEAVKHRAEEGSARLNFVVDKYDIRPGFGSNARELQKIRETIDLVRNDSDVELTGISLHGYASPDGTYRHNAQLAANRTQALRDYLQHYYSRISGSLFTVSSTAEDWDGVRAWLSGSSLPAKEALLKIVDDNSRTPDEKDRLFAARYGDLYRTVILKDVYPPLRRTDYKVTYNVRNFNLEEARRIIRERPQKLSLQEMYRVANSYEKGSREFNQVFDVAVRMFPDDATASLNAANVALSRGDTVSAAQFLSRAGNSAEALNARGILAVKQEDYRAARRYFEQAAAQQLPEAAANLKELENQGE